MVSEARHRPLVSDVFEAALKAWFTDQSIIV